MVFHLSELMTVPFASVLKKDNAVMFADWALSGRVHPRRNIAMVARRTWLLNMVSLNPYRVSKAGLGNLRYTLYKCRRTAYESLHPTM